MPEIPATARRAVWVQNNVLGIREVPVPVPGPGEVLVRIRACGICGSELHAFHSDRPRQHIPGIGPGHELAGEVAAVGPGVRGLEPGMPVAPLAGRVCGGCEYCRGGRYQLCPRLKIAGVTYPGGMSEYFLAQAPYVYRVPDGMSWPVAALSEPCAISLHGMKRAGLRRGQRVLVLGAGTIGLFAALIAVDSGASRVGITARYPQQAAAARTLGATDVFDPNDAAALAAGSWDIVVETVGGTAPTLQQAIDLVGRGGTILLLGVHTEPQTINTFRIFLHDLHLVGSFGYDNVGPRSDYEETLELLQNTTTWSHS
jgi:L-iditol 2-dehydrogenase